MEYCSNNIKMSDFLNNIDYKYILLLLYADATPCSFKTKYTSGATSISIIEERMSQRYGESSSLLVLIVSINIYNY